MFNMIKMEWYRMRRTRSAYIVWFILLSCIFFTNMLTRDEYREMDENPELAQEYMEYNEEAVHSNFGMDVTITTEPGEKVTVYDMVYANVRGKFIALFIVIFVVLFAGADLNSGYIKNIGGQVQSRYGLMAAKIIMSAVYAVLTLALYVLIQALFNRFWFGYLEWGDLGEFLPYMGVQTALHCALAAIIAAITVILRSRTLSMLLATGLCMNILTIFYSGIEKALEKVNIKDVDILSHTVTGEICLLDMNLSASEIAGALAVAAAFTIAAVAVSCFVFEKRDI